MAAKLTTPVIFNGKTCDSLSPLLNDMASDWTEGRNFLLSGEVQKVFRKIDTRVASTAATAVDAYKTNPAEADHIFWKWLYKQAELQSLYWRGRNYGSWAQVAQRLQNRTDSELTRLFRWMLQEQQVCVYARSLAQSDEVIQNIRFLERNYSKTDSRFRKSKAIPLLLLLMKQTKTFRFGGTVFQTTEQFAACLQKLAQGSKEQFADAIKPLFLDEYNFTPEFEAWILNQSGPSALSSWSQKYQEGLGPAEDDELPDETGDVEVPDTDTQDEEAFARAADGFEEEFLRLLTGYPDALSDPQRFSRLMNDFFPRKPLQVHLIVILHRMDIMRAIHDAAELSPAFTRRFMKRLSDDFGVKTSFAKWAVSVWCVCYGEQVLGKPGSAEPDTVP